MFAIAIMSSLWLAFLMHLFLVRICGLFKQSFSRQKGIILGFFLGFIPLGLMFYFWIINLNMKNWPMITWSGFYLLLIYSLFSYAYFHLFNMSETARRVRILAEISKTGVFKKDELSQKYPPSDIVQNRLKRLLALGELRLSQDRYLIGMGMFILPAKIVFSLHSMLFPSSKNIENTGVVNIK